MLPPPLPRKPLSGMRNTPLPQQIPGLYFTIFSISWTLCLLFQLPSKSASVDTPVLNSTLHDLQTLQGHHNKAISWVS